VGSARESDEGATGRKEGIYLVGLFQDGIVGDVGT